MQGAVKPAVCLLGAHNVIHHWLSVIADPLLGTDGLASQRSFLSFCDFPACKRGILRCDYNEPNVGLLPSSLSHHAEG
jgi:hypothetical protein